MTPHRSPVGGPARLKKRRCKDCRKWTDAGPCPGCGIIVCQVCAEREGMFCCDSEPAKEPA